MSIQVSYAVRITNEQGWSVACPLRTSQYQWRYVGRNQRTTDCILSNARFFLTLSTRCQSRFYAIKMTLILASEAPTVFELRSLIVFTRFAMLAPRNYSLRKIHSLHHTWLTELLSLMGHLRRGDSVFRTYTPPPSNTSFKRNTRQFLTHFSNILASIFSYPSSFTHHANNCVFTHWTSNPLRSAFITKEAFPQSATSFLLSSVLLIFFTQLTLTYTCC